MLRKEMKQEGIDFYMISTSDFHQSEYVDDYFKAREYFSGFTGSNGTLIVGEKTAGLWTDGRYFIQAEKELAGTGISLFRMMEEGVPDIAEYLLDTMEKGQTFGFDGRTVSGKTGLGLQKKLADKKVNVRYEKDLAGGVWKDRPALPAHPVMILPQELCGQSTEEKIKAVREKLAAAGVQYLVLGRLDDLMWLFNIRGRDVDCNPVALSYGFLSMTEAYLFIQKQEITDEMVQYAGEKHILLKDYHEMESFLEKYSYQGKVLLDLPNINYTLYQKIAAKTGHVTRNNPTELLKAVKNKTELASMEKIYLLDSVAVIRFIYWLKNTVGKENITELSAAEHLDSLRGEIPGFLELSFPTISAYKENAAMMHYEATPACSRKVEPEGMLLVDSGGQYMGGTTDVTRTIVLGKISDEIRLHFTKTAVGMLRLSDARFLYGCSGRNLDILARQPLWELGIDYKCGTGHGIGYILNVHEGPQSIRWRFAEGVKEAVLEEGMVISNEPGVYIEGSHGIRTENVITVKKGEKNGDGQFMYFETLTWVPIDRDGIDVSCMQPEDLERLNRYHAAVYEKTNQYLTEEEREWLKEVTKLLTKES